MNSPIAESMETIEQIASVDCAPCHTKKDSHFNQDQEGAG